MKASLLPDKYLFIFQHFWYMPEAANRDVLWIEVVVWVRLALIQQLQDFLKILSAKIIPLSEV